MEKRTKESKKRVNSLILLVAFTAIMLIVSTYAWFTSQKDITLSNLRGTVEVVENMEISLDAANWFQEIDLANAQAKFDAALSSRDAALGQNEATRTTAASVIPTELLPASGGVGTVAVNSTVLPLYQGVAQSKTLTKINQVNTSGDTDKGYFAFDIYIKNTAKDGLPDTLQLNLNSAVQVLMSENNPLLPGQYNEIVKKDVTVNGVTTERTYNGDSNSGLQNTVRVALALYGDNVAESTADQKAVLEATNGKNITKLAIWEPNSKDHVEYVVKNNNSLNENGTLKTKFGASQYVDTYAVNGTKTGTDSKIEDMWNISDTGLSQQKTTRTEKTSASNYRINTTADVVGADRVGKPIDIKDINEEAFQIQSNKISRLRVYIWLEGQDVDCINQASYGGGIEIDLGLTKDDFVGDVLGEAPVASN